MKRSIFYLMLLCAILPTTINSKMNPEVEEEYSDDYYDDVPNSIMLTGYKNKRVNDTFEYRYVINDGTSHEVEGSIRNVDGKKLITAKGEYRWELETGVSFVVVYEADKNGFRIIKTQIIIDDRTINPKTIESFLG